MVVFSNAYCDYFKLNNLQLNLQLIPNYFKNEKFVKFNTFITNDNVHEEAKYFSCQTCDKCYTQSHNCLANCVTKVMHMIIN